MAKFIKNTDTVTQTYLGQEIQPSAYYQIQVQESQAWANSSSVLTDIASGLLVVAKTDSGTDDIVDVALAINWLKDELIPMNPETGGAIFSPKYAPTGWTQQMFETEFKTSTPNSIHEKDWTNTDIGWTSLKFYDANETELTDPSDIDTLTTRTDMEWMPTIDYMIKGGMIGQIESPTQPVYVWVLAAVLSPANGGPQACFSEGGINMEYQDARTKTGLDGVSGTILYYTHPQLGSGAGTNKLVFVVRHPAGYKHRLQAIFDIFRA